ncbi:MAG: diaminopimelate epimerase [Flavobacteriaceae bacterium]|nr:MAG: diaminopimelate epimerase [Flavobacteriaceae bacterium]
MKIHFYKYQGTGNDFVMIDNRNLHFPKDDIQLINKLCDRRFGVGADGLILLENADDADFNMVYFNADGTESTMCGNGGRCLVAFANQLNIIDSKATFNAVDGLHQATFNDGIVSLQMIDVNKVETHENYFFLDTGSPHHVEMVNGIEQFDVKTIGAKIRNGAPYFEEGTNVNFVEAINDNSIKVRTYERGVEDETFSCGTGVTAAAIATFDAGITKENNIDIEALGGKLSVSFEKENDTYKNVFLTGPATFVFQATIEI